MDWINEKIENMRGKVRELPLKKSLLIYLTFGVGISFMCFWGTRILCERQIEIIYGRHNIKIEKLTGQEFYMFLDTYEMTEELTDEEVGRLLAFGILGQYAGYVYLLFFTGLMGVRFYNKRIRRPALILGNGAREIQKNNLDVDLSYDCKDEMGELCLVFDEMRRELSDDKEKMWKLFEEQKKINAAFAHDLRTPLTVLKGYSDFLYRFIPEGKISEEKLIQTLKLMSEHIGRLERYSYTMKEIRNFDERKVEKEKKNLADIAGKIQETADALNQIGDVQIHVIWEKTEESLWIDEGMVLESVDNLLSNAIRYAKSKVEITIEAEETEKMLRIYVKDDGKGFDKEKMEQAKAPYYYEGEAKEKEGEHFGIGLHIASVLCEKCGGTLELTNSIYGGAFASVSFSYRKD